MICLSLPKALRTGTVMAFPIALMHALTRPAPLLCRVALTVIMIILQIRTIVAPMYMGLLNIKAAPFPIQIKMVLMMKKINAQVLLV